MRWPAGGDVDFSRGVAITSSFRPTPDTHVEPVRYGHGSNAMGLLSTVLTDGDGPGRAGSTWLGDQLRDPRGFARATAAARAGRERTIIALVMQSVDNSLVVSGRAAARPLGADQQAGPRRRRTRPGSRPANEVGAPAGRGHRRRPGRQRRRPGRRPDDRPLPRRRPIGADAGERRGRRLAPRLRAPGPARRRRRRPISANLGVNPSLTITAQAERAMSFWPVQAATPTRGRRSARRYQPVAPVPAGTPPYRA